MIDFHSHLMPGVDDGAADIDESRTGLQMLYDQGVRTIITTPHIRASLTHSKPALDSYLDELDAAFEKLQTLAGREFPELRLERGVEMALDVPAPRLGDRRLHLAGGDFVLVEFPFMSVPPNSAMPLRELRSLGVTPIVAHPERYANITVSYPLIEEWKEVGACIQINAGSLLGMYGATAKRIVWRILEDGLADYMCSDYHSRGRLPLTQAAQAMMEKGAAAQHRLLTLTNPQRMLRSEAPIAADPLEDVQLGFWKKVFGRKRDLPEASAFSPSTIIRTTSRILYLAFHPSSFAARAGSP
jgi:protein-tyrosine phosphatase